MVVKWKAIAIVFIILFIIETTLLLMAYQSGTKMIDNKLACSNEVCYNIQSDSFIYDDTQDLCSCYINGEEVYREYMK